MTTNDPGIRVQYSDKDRPTLGGVLPQAHVRLSTCQPGLPTPWPVPRRQDRALVGRSVAGGCGLIMGPALWNRSVGLAFRFALLHGWTSGGLPAEGCWE